MRVIRSVITAVAATALLTIPLLLVVPAAKAVGPDTDQVIRNGTVLALTGTNVTVKEWAGTYTYRLSPTGRQAIEAAQIRPGDTVRFTVNSPWEIAYDFKKMERHAALSPNSKTADPHRTMWRQSQNSDRHIAVSPGGTEVIGG